jgi:hypothetical protein
MSGMLMPKYEVAKMAEFVKKQGFVDMVSDRFSLISRFMVRGLFSPVAEGAEEFMNHVEARIMRLEKRMLRRISYQLMMWLGGAFLALALFYFQVEFLGWSRAIAFLTVGIIVIVAGLMIKATG